MTLSQEWQVSQTGVILLLNTCTRLVSRPHAKCFCVHHTTTLASYPGEAPSYSHFTDEPKLDPPHEVCVVQWEDKLTLHT